MQSAATVSHQVAKLESLGLVSHRTSSLEGRARKAATTEEGRIMIDALNAAREQIVEALVVTWDKQDLRELVRLLRSFTDDALMWTKSR